VTGPSGALEREVKLDAPVDLSLAADAWADLVLPGPSGTRVTVDVRDAGRLELDATYYDTPSLALRRAGASLRRRTGEGTRWTAKLPVPSPEASSADLGATVRLEVDLHDEATSPPRDACDLVEPFTQGAALEPVARIVSHRQRRRIVAADASLAEIDDDAVEVRRPGSDDLVATFREIEVEFSPETPPEVVRRVVDSLLAAGATRSGGISKVDRALGLLGRT
jgi:inorganic triphosphatase YgiF